MKIRLQREYLDHGVIESKASGRCFSCDPAPELLVLGKCVDDEGFWPGPYELDAVLDLLQLETRGQRQNLDMNDAASKSNEMQMVMEAPHTVMMGSSGPNISSFMISASSGGSSSIVGSMNLQRRR